MIIKNICVNCVQLILVTNDITGLHNIYPHYANRDERYQFQYRFINPLESDLNKFPKSIFIKILRPHGRPFEKINIENEAFAL